MKKDSLFRGTKFFGASHKGYFNVVLLRNEYFYIGIQSILCSSFVSHVCICDLDLMTKPTKFSESEKLHLSCISSYNFFCIPFLKTQLYHFIPQYLYNQYYPFIVNRVSRQTERLSKMTRDQLSDLQERPSDSI